MDKHLSAYLDSLLLPFNKPVVEGLAKTAVPMLEEHIDSVFKIVAKSYPKGLEYVGCRRATVTEEMREVTRPKQARSQYDIAESDLYMMQYNHRFEGEDLPPRYIYLPYVGDAGTLMLNGTIYYLPPVISDKVISPTKTTVFVRLLKDKLIFRRAQHLINVNGRGQVAQLAWAGIYRKQKSDVQPTTNALTINVHYLLAHYGFSGMFEKFTGCVPVIGRAEINSETYPPDKWTIVTSTGIKPSTNIDRVFEGSDIAVAIPNDHWTPQMLCYIGGFFYILDHFPNRIDPAWVDNVNLWTILLGHVIFSGLYSEGKLHMQITKHFNSISSYVDSKKVEELEELGYKINDFYELLALLVENITDWIVEAQSKGSEIYGRNFEILYYVCAPITQAIFIMNYALLDLANKKTLSLKDITDVMNMKLKPGPIYQITRNSIGTPVSYSGDNYYIGITSTVTEQNLVGNIKKVRRVVDETARIDASQVEVGSILNLSKANPSPILRDNPFMCLDEQTGNIIPNPYFEVIRQELKADLENLSNDQILEDEEETDVELTANEPNEEDEDDTEIEIEEENQVL